MDGHEVLQFSWINWGAQNWIWKGRLLYCTGCAFSQSQKGEGFLLKCCTLPTVFPQRGGVVQIYTKMCFGLGRERFAMKNSGSLVCVCSWALGWGPAAGYSTVAGSCPRWVVSLLTGVPVLRSSLLLERCLFIFFLLCFDVFCSSSFPRYESPNIALRCGIMLRECIRHEPLAKIILFSEQFRDFFKYVEMSTFDIASDAFATFKVNYSVHASYFVSKAALHQKSSLSTVWLWTAWLFYCSVKDIIN